MAAMIIGVIAIFAGSFFVTSQKQAKQSRDVTIALYLADSLMEEIGLRIWDDKVGGESVTLGPDAGESASDKTQFDDMDDYNGHTESVILYPDGRTIAGFRGFTRSVIVSYVKTDLSASVQPTQRKKVQITVMRDGKERIKIHRIFAKRWMP